MHLRYVLTLLAAVLVAVALLPVAALAFGASLADVASALHDHEVRVAIATSVGCAAAATALGVVFGVPAGYLLARRAVWGSRLWQALLDLPVVIPHPVVGIGLLLVFGRHRLLGAALREELSVEVVSAMPGIVLAMLVVGSPFIVKASRDGFCAVPHNLEGAARSLGASESRFFFTIALPLAAGNIRSGALLAWARAVSEFGSVAIIAYYPKTAPVVIWDRFSVYGLRAAIGPCLLLLGVCLSLFLIVHYFAAPPAPPLSSRRKPRQ